MILYLRKLRGVVPECLGRDAPAAFQHALPAVPSVLLGKGSGQVVSSGHLETLAQAGAQTRMTHLIPMLCLDLRAPYSAELVQRPQLRGSSCRTTCGSCTLQSGRVHLCSFCRPKKPSCWVSPLELFSIPLLSGMSSSGDHWLKLELVD